MKILLNTGKLPLLLLVLLTLISSSLSAAGDCSPYLGQASLNEFFKDNANQSNDPDDLAEVKLLNVSIPFSTYELWTINICEYDDNGNNNDEDGCSGAIQISDFTENADPPWFILKDGNIGKYMNFSTGFDAILLDEEGDVIDYVTVDGYSPQEPTGGCTLADLPYDYDAVSGGTSFKIIYRIPDGTGDWDGATSATEPPTEDDTNDVLPPPPAGETYPSITINDVTAPQGGTATFTISFTDLIEFSQDVTINYATSDGSATDTNPDSDYTGITGSVTIPAGSTSNTVDVSIDANGDVTEYFFLVLKSIADSVDNGGSPNATIANHYGTATIIAGSPSVDHYELSIPSSSVSCLSPTVTVTACSDNSSPCTNAVTTISGEIATLATSAGNLALTTITFDATGIATTTLSYSAAANDETVTVTLSDESSTATNSRQCCPDGANCSIANSCDINLKTAGFIFSTTAAGSAITYPPVLATTSGSDSTNYFLRAIKTNTSTKACEALLTGTQSVDMAYTCTDPASCSPGNLMTIGGATFDSGGGTSSLTFDSDGAAPFTLNFMDVGRISLSASKSGVGGTTLTGTSASAFVIKPYSLVLTDIKQTAAPHTANPEAADASGNKFVIAGEQFSATVTAVNASCAANLSSYTLLTDIPASCITPNYGQESTPETITLSSTLVAGLGLVNNPTLNNPSAFGNFSGGSAIGTTFSWDEVGIINLTAATGDGDYLGSGAVSGTESPNVGRFVPASFTVTVASNGSFENTHISGIPFTYLGQPFDYTANPEFTITAVNSGGGTTANYTGAFSFLDPGEITLAYPTADKTQDDDTGTATKIGVASVEGTHTLSANGDGTFSLILGDTAADSFTYDRTFGMVAPFTPDLDILLTSINETNDSVSYGGTATATPVGNLQRLGRATLSDVYGSTESTLSMPFNTEYYDGATNLWRPNTDDTTTTISANGGTTCASADFSCSVDGSAADMQVSGINITPGDSLTLTPTIAINGEALITLTTPNWLTFDWDDDGTPEYASATATFGIYRGDDRFYYWREER